MNAIFKKLNFKGQKLLHILNAPPEFMPVVDEMLQYAAIETTVASTEYSEFILVFVTEQNQIDDLTPVLASALNGDGLLWYAYPKGTSRKYSCNFNRDTGWQMLGKFGFEGVRQVAIDEDWTALRFRRVEYIKNMKRDPKRAMSKEGKKRLT